jgi:hypothetical protein
MSDVGCDQAGTLGLNANSICCQDEECIQLHPDMHDAMPVFPANKNCTVTQTRTRGEKKNCTIALHIYTSGDQIREYYMARARGMRQRSELVILMGKAERKKETVSWTNVQTEVYQNGS